MSVSDVRGPRASPGRGNGDAGGAKRLLVVANPFPPMASAGTTRVVRFLRHLPEYGWEPTVLTARAQGPAPVPPGVRVERAPVPVPAPLLRGGRRSTRANQWLFVPDPFAPWVPGAVALGRRLLADEPFDAIFSSSPRPSVHVVASILARRSGVPWLADYRDPWTTYQFRRYPTPAHRASHRRLEAWCLRQAAAVTAVNRPIADDLLARHTFIRGRTHVLANGFDPAEAADDVALEPGFWFVHTGRLYGREEQTAAFLAALATLPQDVGALFVGVDESRVRPQADRVGLGARVRVEALVPHARSLGLQRTATALLLVNGRRPEAMSSKVFEYLHAGRPIFAISPERSAARALFADTGGAVCVTADEPMAPPLAAFVADVRAGAGPRVDAPALAPYQFGSLTGELVGILGGMEAPHRTRD
jgi:glycosyltransferase involved in cell wall biosynthesis